MSEDPPIPQMHEALLVPELAEVYLLLDNLSGAANKSLPDLSSERVFQSASRTWVEQLCAIRWPPEDGEQQNESLNAAKLIRAKDALNREAWPASGASIAFTLMLSGESANLTRRAQFSDWVARHTDEAPPSPDPRDRLGTCGPFSRQSLAALAYPTLFRGMRKCRYQYLILNWFLVVALIATCWLSWEVATGVSLLNRVDTLVRNAQVLRVAGVGIDAGDTSTDAGDTSTNPSADPADIMQTDPKLLIPISNLMQWVDDNRWLAVVVGGHGQVPYYRSGRKPPDDRMSNVEWAAVLIGVLAGTVLPIFYGLLGASAAVVRNLSARMSANTLMPRDLVLGFVQLALGCVIGACVGLFVGSDGNAASGAGLIGTVHLSGSALCFLAGFGVEGVFRALELFVSRVFPVGSSPAPVAPTAGGRSSAARQAAIGDDGRPV